VHNIGWIHRDIKPDNIYFDSGETSRIVLNDWSSAVRVGIECAFVGTLLFGDPPNENGIHIPTPQLDMRSLVRTAFCLSKQRLPWVKEDPFEILQYWERVGKDHPLFATAMDKATIADYDSLEYIFSTSWL
jgi:serine/threonine protein kinase